MQRAVPVILAILVLFGALSSCLFVVDQRQFAVVFALGEIKQVVDKPGLHFKLPPPFQNVQYYDKRILTIDTADVDRFITSEKLNVQIDTFVKWRISDPKTFIRSVNGSELIAADRISRSLRDSLNNEIAKRTVADVISGQRSTVIVVSDFVCETDWPHALGQLARRHDVVAVRLFDPLEQQMPELGVLNFRDAETGETLLVDTHDARWRARFAQLAATRETALRQAFGAAGVDTLELSTEGDLADALLRFDHMRRQRAGQTVGPARPLPRAA